MITERISNLQKLAAERGKAGMPTHFASDYHRSALTVYKDLPHWEKLARAMAYAIENQDVFAYEDDRIGGRIYYSREEKPEKETKVPPLFYRKYPALREAIRSRNAIYNKQISLVEELEEQGKLIVLRPERPIVVDRMERNTQKLIDLYDEGYECASKIEFII